MSRQFTRVRKKSKYISVVFPLINRLMLKLFIIPGVLASFDSVTSSKLKLVGTPCKVLLQVLLFLQWFNHLKSRPLGLMIDHRDNNNNDKKKEGIQCNLVNSVPLPSRFWAWASTAVDCAS